MRHLIDHHGAELWKGALGVASTLIGVLTSMQDSVEHLMRCLSLGVGILVGVLTAVSIVRGWRKKP